MIKCFNSLFVVVVFPLLTLLTGCSSESQPPVDAVVIESQSPVDAVVVEITVTPSSISVLAGRTRQLIAIAKYDDESEKDVSNSVVWEIVGDPIVADVSDSGLLTGKVKGDTEFTATKDGITSKAVKVNVCDLAEACLDIFDTGSGKLFTSSPSVAYLDSIGGNLDNLGNSLTDAVETEEGSSFGPDGSFYLFNWNNANILCQTYNTNSIGGRTNWRLATQDELEGLFASYGNMFTARGWPVHYRYWLAAEFSGYDYYDYMNLFYGYVDRGYSTFTVYASCVSNP